MPLWSDIIEPAELTGYARASLEEMERAKGSLARYLPNREVPDIVARLVAGESGLVEEARYRAFDAELEISDVKPRRRITVDLPAVGTNKPVSEQMQLRTRNATNEDWRSYILRTVDEAVSAVADRIERTRGIVLATGKATIDQMNFQVDNDFGRSTDLTVTASTLWSASGAKPLSDLVAWIDKATEISGTAPGRLVMGRKVLRALLGSEQLRTVLPGGATRPATLADAQAILDADGLPTIEVFTRRTRTGTVIPDDTVLLLPEPVDPVSGMSDLGATFWGQTLTASDGGYALELADQPGLVAGVYRGEKPPMIAEVIADAIALPVLANANLSMAAKVL